MNPIDIILKKRHGQELTTEEIYDFTTAITRGYVQDYQVSALLMAICFQGMTERETVDLTMAMAYSGDVLDLSDAKGVKVDKHSTGGVGDTTTLILAPLAAACGATVAKMSGRGLGHTGGTLDKLESIPGLSVSLSKEAFIAQLNHIGCGVIGQTGDLVPADKVLYALRDVTGTVDCVPLIVSSILSKKIAAGADVVMLDVKTGSGALMPTLSQSVDLARQMVKIGNRTKRKFLAMVTDMDQPLGLYIGNALEVEEAILVLRGQADGKLMELSLLLCAHMLWGAGLVETVDAGLALAREKLRDGSALHKLGDMIEAQGGDRNVTRQLGLLPHADHILQVHATRSGHVQAMKTSEIGNAAKALGAGRERKEDLIDPAAGLVMRVRVGDWVEKGDLLYEIHATGQRGVKEARAMMKDAVVIGAEKSDAVPLVYEVIVE